MTVWVISRPRQIKMAKVLCTFPFELEALRAQLNHYLNHENYDEMLACVIGAQHAVMAFTDDEEYCKPLRTLRGLLV